MRHFSTSNPNEAGALRNPTRGSFLSFISRRVQFNGMTVLTAGVVIALVYLLIVPMGAQLYASLRGPTLPYVEGATTGIQNFIEISDASGLGVTIRDTGIFVLGSVAVSFAIGLTFAWLVERTDFPGRSFLFVMILIPFIMPQIVRAQAWLLMLSPKTGIVNEGIRAILPFWERGPIIPQSMFGMVLVQGLGGGIFFFLMLSAMLRNMDSSLEEAGRVSGAGIWQIIRRVTLPILRPGVLAVLLLSIIHTLGVFEVPLLFGIAAGANIFSLRIWNAIQGSGEELPLYGIASAYGIVFLLLTSLLFVIYAFATRQASRFATVGSRGFRPQRVTLGKWTWVIMFALAFYFLINAVLPIVILIWQSLLRFYVPFSWNAFSDLTSLDAYRVVLFEDQRFWGALTRTLIVASLSAILAVTLSTVAAWIVVRTRSRVGGRLLDLFVTSSVAIPATVAAVAFFLFYFLTSDWIPLYGTMWVLVVAYAYRTSVAYRITYAGVIQVSNELEEAAAVSGAGRLYTLRRIVVPLLMPSMFVAWLQLFIIGTHEFTIAIFLVSSENLTLPVEIFSRFSTSEGTSAAPSEGAAMGVLLTLLVTVLVLVLRRIVSRIGVQETATA